MTRGRWPPVVGRWRNVPGFAHAVRVALAASLLIGLVYVGCVVILDELATARQVAAVDALLHERLTDARAGQLLARAGDFARAGDDGDVDGAPVLLWLDQPPRDPVALSPGAPQLSAADGNAAAAGRPVTIRLRSGQFRITAIRYEAGLLVAGQSLAEQGRIEAVLLSGEVLAAPVLLLAVFIGALIIGLRALAPVERSRQRQLDFTADASHELRTPLSVISAETAIAMRAERSASEYQAALGRIQDETQRLRTIVEDLLWLARFDSTPPQPDHEPLDLGTVARECADRFSAVAHAGSFTISVDTKDSATVRVSAPPEWIHRLSGVLVDNACRYAGHAGQVRISVSQRGNRAALAVEDSGPGLTAQQKERLFDRFHRSNDDGGSAGLGLAIADSIVSRTGGQWRIGKSELGGALFEISWRRSPAS